MKITGLLLLSTILSSGHLGASSGDAVAATAGPLLTVDIDAGGGAAEATATDEQKLTGLRQQLAALPQPSVDVKQVQLTREIRSLSLAIEKAKTTEGKGALATAATLMKEDSKPLACPAFQRIMDRNLLARATPSIKGEDSIRLMQNPTRTESLFMNIGLKFGAFKVNTLPSISFVQKQTEDLLKDLKSLVKELGDLDKQLARKGASLRKEKNEAAIKLVEKIIENTTQLNAEIGLINNIIPNSLIPLNFDSLQLGDFKTYLEFKKSQVPIKLSDFRKELNVKISAINPAIKTAESTLYKAKKAQQVRQKEIAPRVNTAAHIYSLLKQGHVVFKANTKSQELEVSLLELPELKVAAPPKSSTSLPSLSPPQTQPSPPPQAKTVKDLKESTMKELITVLTTTKADEPKNILNLVKRYKALDQLDDLGVEGFDGTPSYYVLIKPDAELYSKKVDLEEFINAVMFKQKPKSVAKPKDLYKRTRGSKSSGDQALYATAGDLYTGKKAMQWYMGKKISSSVKNLLTFCKARDSRICSEKETELVQSIHRCEHKYLPRCFKGAYNNPLITNILENIYEALKRKWGQEIKKETLMDRRSPLTQGSSGELMSKDDFLDNSRLRKNVLAYIRLTELTNRETSWSDTVTNSKMLRKHFEMMMQDIALAVNDMSDLQGSKKMKDLAQEVFKKLLNLNEEERDTAATEHGKTLEEKQKKLETEQEMNSLLSELLANTKREMKGYRRPFSH